MKRISGLLLAFALFSFLACSDDKDESLTGDLEFQFVLEYDGQPLVMNETLKYEDALPINFSRVNMYLSDFSIGDQTLSDIAFLDFTNVNVTSAQALAGQTIRFENLQAGDYENVEFSIGVPEDLNAQRPADFTADHPLAKSSEYWAGWNSYIFAKYEGKLDLEGDEMLETGFTFHTGSNPVFRSLKFDQNISIDANETTTISFTINAKELFRIDGGYLDLKEIQGAHDTGAMKIMSDISDNYQTAFTMKK